MDSLRIVDAGRLSALRSQAIWHGIAEAMTPATATTLSLCQPGEAYVGLGYHRELHELDLPSCERLGLRPIRRRIGGGPVYIDSDQLFFQITLPAARAPRRVDHLYERLLGPAVRAFRRLGLDANIRGLNDISIEDRRLSGTGAGRIEDGVTVVGNVIFRFPHERMAAVLALPSESMRRECRRLMARHITSLEAEGLENLTPADARDALIEAYAEVLGLEPRPDELSPTETAATERWEERFEQPAWLRGPGTGPVARSSRQIKISADVWCYAAASGGIEVEASFCTGTVKRVRVKCPDLNGTAAEMERRLSDCPLDRLASRLAPFGHPGDRVLELLEQGSVLR